MSKVTAGMKFDSKKPSPMALLEFTPLAFTEVLDVLEYGAKKYREYNWIDVENWRVRYHDAALRHMFDAQSGIAFDTETNRHHLAHAACCMLFVSDFESERAASMRVCPTMYKREINGIVPGPMYLMPPQATMEVGLVISSLASSEIHQVTSADIIESIWCSALARGHYDEFNSSIFHTSFGKRRWNMDATRDQAKRIGVSCAGYSAGLMIWRLQKLLSDAADELSRIQKQPDGLYPVE